MLGPGEIPLEALIAHSEILRFAESIAELTQMECSALRYDPERARPLATGAGIQILRSPICKALNRIQSGHTLRCVADIHGAGHAAMRAGEPVSADCVGGKGTLYACPILLHDGETPYPKGAVVAAAHDVFHFHYADRLAAAAGASVVETEELLCQTDKRCLNAAQLRRIRVIMDTQTRSYSRQISDRYAQFKSAAVILQQEQELNQAYQQLDAEFRKVGEVQRVLVPEVEPDLKPFSIAAYYRPAQRAGGDYYDFFPQPDGSCGVLVADVSGHGPGAAVVMAMMRALLNACPYPLRPPAELLEYANGHLCEMTTSDQFVTAFAGVLDPDGHNFCYASAGHNPPLLFEAASGRARELAVESSLPLGVSDDTTYSQSRTSLNPGDIMLLFTDGIPDTQDSAGNMFGLSRLAQVLQDRAGDGARAVRDEIVRGMRHFAGDKAPFDDHTLIVIERL